MMCSYSEKWITVIKPTQVLFSLQSMSGQPVKKPLSKLLRQIIKNHNDLFVTTGSPNPNFEIPDLYYIITLKNLFTTKFVWKVKCPDNWRLDY